MISAALVEQTVKGAAVYDKFQFERIGFFSVDPDSTEEKVSKTSFNCMNFRDCWLLFVFCVDH